MRCGSPSVHEQSALACGKGSLSDRCLQLQVQEAFENHLICAPSLLPEYIEWCYSEQQLLGGKSVRLLCLDAIASSCRRRNYAEETDLAALWVLALHLLADGSPATRRAAAFLSQTLVDHSQLDGVQTPRFNTRPTEDVFSVMVT